MKHQADANTGAPAWGMGADPKTQAQCPAHCSRRLDHMRSFLQRSAFALANTTAVLVALYVAFAADLQRPYWAVFSAFIIAAPITGMVRSKAVWRLLGTSIGATAALLLVPPLVQSPPLLCLAMAVWVALCLWWSLLDRTPRSYAPMLAGYTATIVGFAVVEMPQAIFDNAVARVEEIALGIACGAVVHSIFSGRTVADVIDERISDAVRLCAGWIAQTLAPASEPSDHLSASRRLAVLATDLHSLGTNIAFDLSDVPRIGRHLFVLQNRLALLPARLTSLQLTLQAVGHNSASHTRLDELLGETVNWAHGIASAPDVLGDTQSPPAARLQDSSELLERAATTQVEDLIVTLEDCRLLGRAIRDATVALPIRLEEEVNTARSLPHFRDHALAGLSAGAAAIAVMIACALWIVGSWPEGAIAAQFAAIGCSFFATLDRPSKMLGAALIGVLLALPFAAIYQFAILPRADGFASLALVLAPVVLLLSYLQAVPKLAGAALILAITFSGGLAFQETYQSDFAAFVNINLAEVAGVLLAIAINLVFRTIDPAWNARRLSRAAWRGLSGLTQTNTPDKRGYSQLVDCLGQVAQRAESIDVTTRARLNVDVLRDLRVSASLTAINTAERHSAPLVELQLAAIRHLIGSVYSARAHSKLGPAPEAIEQSLDLGIEALAAQPPDRWVVRALAGLVVLRMDLVPDAPPPSFQAVPA